MMNNNFKLLAVASVSLVLTACNEENAVVPAKVEIKAAPERAQVEPERAKAESERSKAEPERAKAEFERAKAEFERDKAESEIAKAESERAKAESERVTAEFEAAKSELEKAKAEFAAAQAKSEAAKAKANVAKSEYTQDFNVAGSEPYWSLNLKHSRKDKYKAIFSYLGGTGIVHVSALVTKHPHKGFVTYDGKTRNGKFFSAIAVKKPCNDETKGDVSSHMFSVQYNVGCGGKLIKDSDDADSASYWKKQTTSKANLSHAHKTAKAINTQGYRLYRKGKYHKALPYFQFANRIDGNYALSQYNLACTASIVLANYKCGQDDGVLKIANPHSIFEALKKSIRLDPKRKSKSQTDPDLALLRKSYRYYRDILHYSPNNDKQLNEMLENIEWTHKLSRLRFSKGSNSVTAIKNKWHKKVGKYSLDKGLITLTFTGKEDEKLQTTGRLLDKGDGVLNFPGAAKAHILNYDDFGFSFPSCKPK